VDLCRLSDLPFSGPKFTWRRNCTLTRIDRALVNDEWIRRMPESSIIQLHKVKSDHRPIVLCPIFQGQICRVLLKACPWILRNGISIRLGMFFA
ncbi:hypothetical protein LINPERHAP1_LOCUS8295, partial [Linum perenne]